MARPTPELINTLRKVASRIERSPDYQWGHMGSCNCGFLAQEITSQNKKTIHAVAMTGQGDWTEQLNDYCPTSGKRMDDLISEILGFGFDTDDLKHLERLSDKAILCMIGDQQVLRYNNKNDVALYIRTWASLLESQLLKQVKLPAEIHGAGLAETQR